MGELDLFEILCDKVGCDYISDLHSTEYRDETLHELATIPLEPYPLQQLSDAAEYVLGEKHGFDSASQASSYFRAVEHSGHAS